MSMALGHTTRGFLVITVSEDKPMYITCSDGVIEVYAYRVGAKTKLSLRASNPNIDFHRDEERMKRALANTVRFDIEEGNGPV